MIHGGASQKKRGPMQPGNTLVVTWKGAEESLGSFTAEMESERAARHMADAEALAGLSALADLLAAAMPC